MRELAVLAAETGCRGRELRKGGDSFGGGAVIYALRRALFGVVIWLGGCFREEDEEDGVAWVGVFAREVGVVERFVGVLARVVGG